MTPAILAFVLSVVGDEPTATAQTTTQTTAATATATATENTGDDHGSRIALPASPPTGSGRWAPVATKEIALLPMVPAGHAARLYAVYGGASAVGALPPGGSMIASIYPTPAFADFAGPSAGARAEVGVLWRRWLRVFATGEGDVAAPGPLLPSQGTVTAYAVGVGGQLGAADAPWQLAPFFGMTARLRGEQIVVGDDTFVTGVLGVAQSFGVELRLDSGFVVKAGVDAWRANFPAFGDGRFIDKNGARWQVSGGAPGERSEADVFVGVLYEAVRQ
jgi:hypothetical protein